jgi:hypothetical protein
MRVRTAEETDWELIVLPLRRADANRAISHRGAESSGRCRCGAGPGSTACDALDALARPVAYSALPGYHLLHSVRGDQLMKMGNFAEARENIRPAIAMAQNLRERESLTRKNEADEEAVRPLKCVSVPINAVSSPIHLAVLSCSGGAFALVFPGDTFPPPIQSAERKRARGRIEKGRVPFL